MAIYPVQTLLDWRIKMSDWTIVAPNNKVNKQASQPAITTPKLNLFDFSKLNPTQSIGKQQNTPVWPFKWVVGNVQTPYKQPEKAIVKNPALPEFAKLETSKFENWMQPVKKEVKQEWLVPKVNAGNYNDIDLQNAQKLKDLWIPKEQIIELVNIKKAQREWVATEEDVPTEETGFKEYLPMAKAWAGKFEINQDDWFLETIWKTIGNVPWWVYNLAAWTANLWANLIQNPIDTTVNVAKWLYWAAESWVNRIQENYSKWGLQWTADTLGDINKLIWENPVETLWIVKPSLVAKWSSKIIKNVIKQPVKWAWYVASEVLGKTTGTSWETIRTAFKQWWTQEFKSALRWNTTTQDILSNTKEWLQSIKDNRSQLYWEEYKKLQAIKTPIKLKVWEKWLLPDVLDSLQKDYKIWMKYNKDWKVVWLDFSQSKITWWASQSQIESIVNDLNKWKDNTPEGLDVLKQRVQDYYRWTAESAKWDRISTIVANKIKDSIIKQVPEYADMVWKYEKLTNDIRDITKTLSLWDKTQAQTAITKLNSVLRDNFPARQDMIKIIEQYTWKNIQAQIAWASLNPALAKWLAWVITGWWIILWQLANPWFWVWLAVASPRLIGELAATIWTPVSKLTEAITNLKKYGNTITNPAMNSVEWSSKIIKKPSIFNNPTKKK